MIPGLQDMQSPSDPLNISPVSSSIFNNATGYKSLAYLGMKPTAPILLSMLTANYRYKYF